MRFKDFILLLIIPLSEIKAIFYNSNKKVDWYLFSDNKRFLCNVVEDYSNILIFGIVFYYFVFVTLDSRLRNISLYLFVLNALDLFHLGLMDLKYLILVKFIIAYIICTQLKRFSIF